MSKKNFTILEYKALYSTSDCVEAKQEENGNLLLPPKTFEAIHDFYFSNFEAQQYFQPAKVNGRKALRAQNYVGVIQTKDGTTIEILPKIQSVGVEQSKTILIKMLKTLKRSPYKNFNMANLSSAKMPLLEIFITMFLKELSELIKKGIKSDYITKEDNLKFLKGKLKIGDQIKHNTVHKERFYSEYQEFCCDRVENRLINTTLVFLYNKSKSNRNQQRIREFLFVFDEIKVSHNIKTDFSKVKLNRQLQDYEQVLLWCKTFLLENSFSPYKGNDIAYALLFDMNLLFESYVYNYLKKSGRFDSITAQHHEHHLAYNEQNQGKFKLKPDIVIEQSGKIIIADTKWKILSEDKTHNGVSQSDMYQLYAYGTKYEECENLFLIYPKDSEVSESFYNYHKDENKNLNLQVLFFDLGNLDKNSDLELKIIGE